MEVFRLTVDCDFGFPPSPSFSVGRERRPGLRVAETVSRNGAGNDSCAHAVEAFLDGVVAPFEWPWMLYGS